MEDKNRKIKDLITGLSTLVLFALAMLLVGVRIFGFTPYAVVSGSMAPSIPKGSLAYVKAMRMDELAMGDVITYVLDESGVLVSHRIVGLDHSTQIITTKGDANQDNDSLKVSYRNVQGVVHYHIPILGTVSQLIYSNWGLLIILLTMGFMVSISILDRVKK